MSDFVSLISSNRPALLTGAEVLHVSRETSANELFRAGELRCNAAIGLMRALDTGEYKHLSYPGIIQDVTPGLMILVCDAMSLFELAFGREE